MEGFSLDRAWSRGVGFISARARDHAIVLIGIGVLLSTALQYGAVGGTIGFMNPATMGGVEGMAGLGGAFLGAVFLGYLLQIGSFFGSWRLGLAREESVGAAAGWGILAGLVFMVLGIVLIAIAAAMVAVSPVAGVILMILVMLPFAIILYSVFVVMMALFMFVTIFFALLFGMSMGASQFFAGTVGEGIFGIVFLLALSALVLWLAARLCCTGPAMARHRTLNLFAGIAESWRATGPGQWRILAYLALVAVVLGIVIFVLGIVAGVGMMAGMEAGGAPQLGVGMLIGTVLAGIAIAYVLVTIPAGIYRAATGEAPVDVFA